MLLSFVPILAILLINVFVLAWVVRHRDRTRSGFFLLLNAVSLIIWVGGQGLYQIMGQEAPWVLSLPYLAALVVPGNFLYYAVSRPHPIRDFWRRPWAMAIIFAPAFLLALVENYSVESGQFFGYSYRPDRVGMDTVARRIALIYTTVMIGSALVVLGVRYYTTTGPDQNTSKHLIATILGPIMFALFFWVSSTTGSGRSVVPSPSFIFAIMAQLGILVVIRQEELRHPRSLTRPIYYLTVILVAFVLMTLFSEFYIFVGGSIVLERTAGWVLVVCTLVLMLVVRFSHAAKKLDDLFFSRAAEYRRIVEETRHELKVARERLRRAERLSVVGEISARMAHEIKNPLGPIRGYTQMMREKLLEAGDLENRERFLQYLEVIQEEVDSIDKRVREFLDSARHPQLMIDKVDVNEMVERCASVIRLELTAGKEMAGDMLPISIDVHLDPDLPPVMADGARLEEALFNIARNALDAMGEHTRGRIVLKTRRTHGADNEDGVEIHILDNGPGFPLDSMEQYFEPFFTQKREGTGLGLAIVKSTLEAHGGRIVLRNRPTGGGEVRLWLPLVARENPGALLPKPT